MSRMSRKFVSNDLKSVSCLSIPNGGLKLGIALARQRALAPAAAVHALPLLTGVGDRD
jgi:hypothetical protein